MFQYFRKQNVSIPPFCIPPTHAFTTPTFFSKFLIKLLRPATLLKKKLWHRCFPVNFVKFLRTPFLQNTSGRMLLTICTNFLIRLNLLKNTSLKFPVELLKQNVTHLRSFPMIKKPFPSTEGSVHLK